MAVLKGNILGCKKQIRKVIRKIKEGKYEIDYTMIKVGTEETKPVYDKDGQGYRTYKRNYLDTFTLSYIDKEAKQNDKSNS